MENPNLFSALAKAQSQITPPHKNKTVTVKTATGQYSFEYADYGAIVEAIKGPLSANGIAFTHRVALNASGGFTLITSLHLGSESLDSFYPLPDARDPKAFGGAITYGKRYCLSALVGVVADDDDDAGDERTVSFADRHPRPSAGIPPVPGNSTALKPASASSEGSAPKVALRGTGEAPGKSRGAVSVPGPSDAQLARLFAIAGKNSWTNEQVKVLIETRYGLSSSRELSREQYDETVYTVAHQIYRNAVMEQFGKI